MRERRVEGLPQKTWGSKIVIDWKAVDVFKVNGTYIKVLSNEMVTKVSKSGNKRKERRLDVTFDGVDFINVGTESIKRGSFIKKLWNRLERENCDRFNEFQSSFIPVEEETSYEENIELLNLSFLACSFKESIQGLVTKELVTEFNNITITGSIIYETPQEKIDNFERIINKIINEATNNDWDEIRNIVYINEWRTTWKKVYTDFFINNWDEIWSNTIRQWCKYHGISEEEYYDNNRNIIDTYEESKYDYLFKDCNTVKEVKRVYRKWSKQLHPDMGGNAEDFKELNKAYDSAVKQAKLIEDILSGEGIDIEDIDKVADPVYYLVA